MKRILVWDLATRFLHWGLAASIIGAFLCAWLGEEKGTVFALHILFGLAAVGFVALRIVWGVLGTRHARFVNYPLSPTALVRYLAETLRGRWTRFAGLNPGAAWAGLAMLTLIPLVVISGAAGGGEAFEDVHEALAYALLGVVGVHLLGLIWHAMHHSDGTPGSMVTGRKLGEPHDEIPSARPLWSVVVLGGALAWVAGLWQNYDRQAGIVRLPVIGTTIGTAGEAERDGEAESRGGGKHREGGRKHGDDDDD